MDDNELEFGMFGAGFAVFKSCGIDDKHYYPDPSKPDDIKNWLEGFNMGFADYPSHLNFEESIYECVPNPALAKKLVKFESKKK